MHNKTTLFIIIVLFINAFYFFSARIFFHHWLVKKGVNVFFGLSGLPGYLEYLYLKSKDNIRNPRIDKLLISLLISFSVILICSLFLCIMVVLS